MPILWRDKMEIDGGAIDTDHKFLIALINEFEAEFDKGFDQYKLTDALKRLEYYTVYHFTREEAIQQRIGYPAHKEHAEKHRQLAMNVRGALQLFSHDIQKDKQGRIKEHMMRLLKLWIIAHIAKEDLGMRPYLKGRRAASAMEPMVRDR